MKTTSCGVLLLCEPGEILLGHATGTPRWDIPKGMQEPGEAALATAVRETTEECGLVLDGATLKEVGLVPYLPAKDLYLFAARVPRLDIKRLHCVSMFTDRHGRLLPEMDGFRWVPFGGIADVCGKNLTAVLLERLDLAALLAECPLVVPVL